VPPPGVPWPAAAFRAGFIEAPGLNRQSPDACLAAILNRCHHISRRDQQDRQIRNNRQLGGAAVYPDAADICFLCRRIDTKDSAAKSPAEAVFQDNPGRVSWFGGDAVQGYNLGVEEGVHGYSSVKN
jgi:hypothetical protein